MRQCIVLFFVAGVSFGLLGLIACAEPFDFPQPEYETEDFRDPFSPQIFPEPTEIDSEFPREPFFLDEEPGPRQSVIELFPLVLQGVIWNTDRPMVIIGSGGRQFIVEKKQDLSSLGVAGIPGAMINIVDISKDGVSIDYEGEVEILPLPGFEYLPNKDNSEGGKNEN